MSWVLDWICPDCGHVLRDGTIEAALTPFGRTQTVVMFYCLHCHGYKTPRPGGYEVRGETSLFGQFKVPPDDEGDEV
jgi:hypothetical protein